ncbi:phosphatase PAP2 family protein [Streptomonospora litoralis]|uniref:PAP2 superfamily protein n=1 Tax=Streptomonospora litoralis TaxID=2498135 RepID=A0A4P6PZU3_9ACTN|nr:phosphatase PAP2 family protein [Streptomonospora litoralis]QBI53856.1 PAP2 superfamily protein [Streptomonospora litoralis]
MNAVWDAEIGVVEWVQSWGGWLQAPMQGVSVLGSQAMLLVVVTLVFWCLHAGLGARTFVAVSGGALLVGLLKIVLYAPRPSWYHHAVRPIAAPTTFGAPSAHASTSLLLWGSLALRSRRRWIWGAAAAVVLAVGVTRIYLGAHFVTDLLAGWLVAAAVLWAALRYEAAVTARWRSLPLSAQVGLALALSLAPLLAAAGWQALVHAGWSPPEAWTGGVPPRIGATSLTYVAGAAGGFFGGAAGLSVLAARGWYSAAGSAVSRTARYVIGISGVVLILAVAGVAVPEAAGASAAVRDYVLFAVLAAWCALGAPELFLRMGLAERPEPAAPNEQSPTGGPGAGRE